MKTLFEKLSAIPEFIICKSCKNEKHNTEFHIHKGYPMRCCKKCHTIRNRKWAIDNKEKVKAYITEYMRIYRKK